MLNSIEKLRQINVDAMRVALPDDPLDLLRSSVGRSAGAKAETRFRKVRIEHRRQDLADGLLNESVEHVWNSEQPLTATFFRDGFPTYRARPIRPIQELLSNGGPVFTSPGLELLDRQTIGARGAPITFDLTPGMVQVGRIDNLLHQSIG